MAKAILSEVVGIGGPFKLSLYRSKEELVTLPEEIAFRYAIVEGELLNAEQFKGNLTKLSPRRAEARLEAVCPS